MVGGDGGDGEGDMDREGVVMGRYGMVGMVWYGDLGGCGLGGMGCVVCNGRAREER